MIDLNSAESIVKAATRCLEVVSARIASDPTSPLVPDLELIADQARALIGNNEKGPHEQPPASRRTELQGRGH